MLQEHMQNKAHLCYEGNLTLQEHMQNKAHLCYEGSLTLQEHMQNKAHLCHEGNVFFHNLGSDGWRAMLQAAVLMINAASVDRVEVDLLTVTGYKQQKTFLSAEKTLYA